MGTEGKTQLASTPRSTSIKRRRNTRNTRRTANTRLRKSAGSERRRSVQRRIERKTRDEVNPLSLLSKELTPDSRGSPAPSFPQESSWGEPKRRIAHSAQRSVSNSPEREADPPPPPQASAQAD